MKFKVHDNVILVSTADFFARDFKNQEGTILSIAENAPCPYQVQFKKKFKRWCKEEELRGCGT
jgi:hypothetical protein